MKPEEQSTATKSQEQSINDLTILKLTAEVEKLVEEGTHYRKKNRLFELIIGIVIFAAGVAFAEALHLMM